MSKTSFLQKLSNLEWVIFITLFTDKQILDSVRKALKVIDAEHILSGDIKIIEPDVKVEANDVARKFRSLIWPIISSVAALLETTSLTCLKYDVAPFPIEQAHSFFNCLTLREWGKLGKALQDEMVIGAIINLFEHIEVGNDLKHLPNGVESILNVSRGHSEQDIGVKSKIFFNKIAQKIKLFFVR